MFKIGDRVIHAIYPDWGVGTVMYITSDGIYAVEFTKLYKCIDITCDGNIPSGKGRWCVHGNLILAETSETKEPKVICPILTLASCSLPTPEGKKECEMNSCAWFDTNNQYCIIHSLSKLRNLF